MCSLTVFKPGTLSMLARRQPHRLRAQKHQTEPVLGVLRNPRCIAVAPLRVDLVLDCMVPIAQHMLVCNQTCLLKHFSCRSIAQGLIRGIATAGHRLPESGPVCALQNEDLKVAGVDHHQHRLRNLVDGLLH